jgi:ankyrin repeat protein
MSNHDERDRQGRTPLHAAALHGNLPEVERLIGAGADPGARDLDGFTPLHLAAQEFQVEAALMLLEAGADVDFQNRFGNSPLFVAVFNSRGRGEMINLLRSRGANPFLENASSQTPFGLSRLIANYEVSQFFADLESPEIPGSAQ